MNDEMGNVIYPWYWNLIAVKHYFSDDAAEDFPNGRIRQLTQVAVYYWLQHYGKYVNFKLADGSITKEIFNKTVREYMNPNYVSKFDIDEYDLHSIKSSCGPAYKLFDIVYTYHSEHSKNGHQ